MGGVESDAILSQFYAQFEARSRFIDCPKSSIPCFLSRLKSRRCVPISCWLEIRKAIDPRVQAVRLSSKQMQTGECNAIRENRASG